MSRLNLNVVILSLLTYFRQYLHNFLVLVHDFRPASLFTAYWSSSLCLAVGTWCRQSLTKGNQESKYDLFLRLTLKVRTQPHIFLYEGFHVWSLSCTIPYLFISKPCFYFIYIIGIPTYYGYLWRIVSSPLSLCGILQECFFLHRSRHNSLRSQRRFWLLILIGVDAE